MRRVKYLFHMKNIGDAPGVLGEGSQGQGILPHKCCGGVGQPLLLASQRYSLSQTIEEDLGSVEDQRLRVTIKLVMHGLVDSLGD